MLLLGPLAFGGEDALLLVPSAALAWVAAGRYEGFWEAGLKPWDTAAGCLLVREAGGFVTDWRGISQPVCDEQVLAGNDALHSKLHKLIAAALKGS